MRYLGKSYYTTNYRLYKLNWKTNKIELLSWTNKHCVNCGKFLSKKNTRERCSKCQNKRYNFRSWRWSHLNPIKRKSIQKRYIEKNREIINFKKRLRYWRMK